MTGKGEDLFRGKIGPGLVPYLFILPALVFYVIFMAIPIVGTFALSFYRWEGISFATLDFVGLRNYLSLPEDRVFMACIWHNLVYIALGASFSPVLALFLAVLLEKGLRLSHFFRGAYFIPAVMSLVVVGVVFSLFLSPELGLVNPFLEKIGLGQFKRAWLGEPGLALIMVILTDVWKGFGFFMFIFIAGLETIPVELYEAARIDGAGRWQNFRFITLPLLKPTATVVIVLAVIGALKVFDLVYVMTFGGPNHSSEVLSTWMYLQGFMFNNVGYGCSVAVALLVITFVITWVQLKILKGI